MWVGDWVVVCWSSSSSPRRWVANLLTIDCGIVLHQWKNSRRCRCSSCCRCRWGCPSQLAEFGELVERVKRFLAHENRRRAQAAAHLQLLRRIALRVAIVLVASATLHTHTVTYIYIYSTKTIRYTSGKSDFQQYLCAPPYPSLPPLNEASHFVREINQIVFMH